MKGSPAIISIDFGIVAVAGSNLVASPPARIATTGETLDEYAFIGHHLFQRSLHRFSALQYRLPAQSADACCVQSNHRNIALPSAVTACINKMRPPLQAQGINRHLRNLRHAYRLAGSDVENLIRLRNLIAR